jgi:hypothetical protein
VTSRLPMDLTRINMSFRNILERRGCKVPILARICTNTL